MYLGIDLGTSSAKLLIVDEAERVQLSATRPLQTHYPRPDWSEQNPSDWVDAVFDTLAELAAEKPHILADVRSIGFSGHMHACLLLDEANEPVRPAILWNDSRAAAIAERLNADYPYLADQLGVLPMAGFTGPKLAWLAENEPETFQRARRLSFPKDYLRFKLVGEHATDPSEAAGSWLFDEQNRKWSQPAIEACGARQLTFPKVCESASVAGVLHLELASRWNMRDDVQVVVGAGDVAAGAAGVGAVSPRKGLISIGTSAQLLTSHTTYAPNTLQTVHAFCHVLEGVWFNMAAVLNGASALGAVARWTGHAERMGAMLETVEAHYTGPCDVLALPYLAGERTPHNDATARAAFIGMSAETRAHHLAQAMMEAIAFSLADGLEVLGGGGKSPTSFILIGGGARSPFWAQMIANILGVVLETSDVSEMGPSFGAARLARCAFQTSITLEHFKPPVARHRFVPDAQLHAAYQPRLEIFRSLYRSLKPEFAKLASSGP
ncbi:xylulokinase [Nitratireductor indicus]|uniref:xylulokinase n=1 Tax=Nitratireductor indicus TaxID=721133 RepID=UPI002875AC2D|nr:xylulokinase [Nitratireductor indicus]MDS1137804.1 xylulokinase [Nitratireductor indicus]